MPTLPLRLPALPFLVVGTLLLSACGSDPAPEEDDAGGAAEETTDTEESESEDASAGDLLADAESLPVEALGLSVPVPEGWRLEDQGLEFGDAAVVAEDETSLVVMGGFDGVMEPPEAGLAPPDLAAHGMTALAEFYYPDGVTRTGRSDEEWELDGLPGHMVEEELTPPDPDGFSGTVQYLALDRGDADPVFTAVIHEPGNDDQQDQAVAIRDAITFD
ncbi:hypothetical protein J4H86_11965 [Spiractinospora alimapuensis]|uniref:hypothetical protein n=1 Tax=Spiractinospora alimapuensis TaxID=2820884 RepID=UPI001F4468FB|nr:hypothetical protein [Spiractinospora alimapuensis]QVQ54328.1 hypothetical protein J4H86_11965 [Spiractinospora alimapuensis]